MGRLNPNLSFFGGGCNTVVILVEGCDSFVGGRGRLGVEKRVGVTFIRAEAATEAMSRALRRELASLLFSTQARYLSASFFLYLLFAERMIPWSSCCIIEVALGL